MGVTKRYDTQKKISPIYRPRHVLRKNSDFGYNSMPESASQTNTNTRYLQIPPKLFCFGSKVLTLLGLTYEITREIDALHCIQPKHELQKNQQQIHYICLAS